METVFDGCHACDVLGSAVTFLDFDANGTLTTRQPIGLLLGDPDDDENMTAELIQRRPESFQVSLNARGYDAGPMDGLPGPQSRSALMDFQVEHCLPPTGQLNDQIANAILSSDGFTTPCADARMPLGISANTPLLSGTYVDSPEKCQSEYLSELENATSLWIIRGLNHQTSGYDNSCTVRRTDISKDLTKFTADCTLEGSAPGPVQWLADVKANNEFTTWNGEAVGSGMSFTRCADDTPLARANTDQSAAASALPVVAADIKTYCAAMTDADGPGEDGTNDAEIVASGANTWRCMDGEVLVCDLGASGRACMQTSQPSEQVLAEMNDFCRKNANSDYIAGYLIGGLADEWRCDGTKPVVVGNIPVDRLGYFLEAWRALDTTDAAANGADLVTENTTATPLESIASSAFDGRYADQAKTIVPISSISWTELMAMGSLLGMPESEIGKNIEVEGSETFATRDFRAKLVSDILLAKEHLPKNIESIRFVANYATWIPNYDFDNGRFDFCFPELLSLPVQSLRTVFSDDGQASASISSLLVVEADGLVDLPYVVTPCWVGSSSDGMYTPSVPNWPQFESSRLVKGIIGGWEGGNLDLKIVNGLYISISEADAERLDKIMRDNAMDNGSAYPQIEVAFLCNISLNGSLDTLVCNVDEVRIGFSEGVGDLLIATRRDGSEKWNIEFGSGMQ